MSQDHTYLAAICRQNIGKGSLPLTLLTGSTRILARIGGKFVITRGAPYLAVLVDGMCIVRDSNITCARVIRNHDGDWIAGIAINLGKGSALQA
ncbi:uncharacterized protein G2W53_016229 [Senna tora]|uniref:Uncharacterized protein n=1 Tax=Senna tora TaxID=362788 RepID=A0A834WJ60_9FABA|nr:uncharacterized protein G2W53_016229 [Senna tora]